MSCPVCRFTFATSSAAFPLSSVAFHANGPSRVLEATNLGRLFIRSVNGSPDLNGHAATNSSYVTRPSRRASLAKSRSDWYFASSSFQYGIVQPRCRNSPIGPGSSVTPSNDRYSAAMTFLMVFRELPLTESWVGLACGGALHRTALLTRPTILPRGYPQVSSDIHCAVTLHIPTQSRNVIVLYLAAS